jgi:hypothetical protein
VGPYDARVEWDSTPASRKDKRVEVAYIVGKEVVQEVVNSLGEVHLGEAVVERGEAAVEETVPVAVATSTEGHKACVAETDRAPRCASYLGRVHFVEGVEVT